MNAPMEEEMYYGGRGNPRGGNLNNQAYYGNSGNVENRRGGYNKSQAMQGAPQDTGHYGHGPYGNNAPVPSQYGGQGGPNMRGGMRNQQTAPRGGGNPMMGSNHHNYYNQQEMNQPADPSMGFPANPVPLNQRGGFGGGMNNPRGGMQGRNQGGQYQGQHQGQHQGGNQRMYNPMPASTPQNPPQQAMPPMQQTPQHHPRNMGQGNNPNMGYNDYNTMPQKGRGNQDQGMGIPGLSSGHGNMVQGQPQGQNRQKGPQVQPRIPPQNMGTPQQHMSSPPQHMSGPSHGIPNPALNLPPPQNPAAQHPGEMSMSSQSEIIMKRYNTLDRGTYFIDQSNKSINFIIDGEADLMGWYDDYLINGYLLYGIVLKVTTLTSRVYVFIEKEHEIFQNFIRSDGDKLRWKNLNKPDELHIATLNSVEKVEIYDNSEEGFEGFVCYTVNEDSQMSFSTDSRAIQDWVSLQRTFLLFEPTSIKKIFLDVLHNWLHQPESTKFQGKSVAAIINPKIPGNAVLYSTTPKYIQSLDGEYYVGVIALQYGRYTLLSQSRENLENFSRLVEKVLDIAEELDGYVMVTNLKRQYDSSQQQKTILILPIDPTLKVVRYEGTMNFDKTKDKLSKVIAM